MQGVTSDLPTVSQSLADYTATSALLPQLRGRTARAVLEELVDATFPEACPAALRSTALRALHLELLTGGVDTSLLVASVPWGSEPRPRFLLGKASEPWTWRAGKLPPVEFVAVLIEPAAGTPEGRQVRAALGRLSHDPACLTELRAAQSATEMLAVLARCPISRNNAACPGGSNAPTATSLNAMNRAGGGPRRQAIARQGIGNP